MKAVQLRAVGEPLEVVDLPAPTVNPGEALVRVAGCGVCHTDIGFWKDGVPTNHGLPITLGHEISGVVVDAEGRPVRAHVALVFQEGGGSYGTSTDESGTFTFEGIPQRPCVLTADTEDALAAAMPDVHVGIGATVGSVIPTKGAVIPAAVGVDIGCGMMAARTSLVASDLPDHLEGVRSAIERAVPHGRLHVSAERPSRPLRQVPAADGRTPRRPRARDHTRRRPFRRAGRSHRPTRDRRRDYPGGAAGRRQDDGAS